MGKILDRQNFKEGGRANNLTNPPPSKTPGVYILRAVGRPIKRVKGTDSDGIIDIGKASDLRTKINAFIRTTKDGKTSHAAGIRYHELGFKAVFPLEKIEVLWKKTTAPEKTEQSLLQAYVKEHKELPPLNRSLPKKK